MRSTLVFRPTMTAGVVYGREVGSVEPLQPIGGVEELTLTFDETKINQANFQSSGGGNRATVSRVNEALMAAKLQDLNPVNMARGLRALRSEVIAGTVTNEAGVARAGGLVLLAHPNPTTVVVNAASGGAAIAPAGNFEVRPEGLFFLDDSPAIAAAKTAWETANPTLDPDLFPGLNIEVDYAHSGYDVLEVLTRAAPIMEFYFAGVNEAMGGLGSGVHLFRCQQGLTQALSLISGNAFATLDIEAEILQDPTKTGVGKSRYMALRSDIPA
jgi:hypothetical protein